MHRDVRGHRSIHIVAVVAQFDTPTWFELIEYFDYGSSSKRFQCDVTWPSSLRSLCVAPVRWNCAKEIKFPEITLLRGFSFGESQPHTSNLLIFFFLFLFFFLRITLNCNHPILQSVIGFSIEYSHNRRKRANKTIREKSVNTLTANCNCCGSFRWKMRKVMCLRNWPYQLAR